WTVRDLLAVGARTRPLIPRLSDSVPDLSHCARPLGALLCRGDLAYALGGSWHHCAWRLSPGKDLTSCMSKPTVCSLQRLLLVFAGSSCSSTGCNDSLAFALEKLVG